MYIYIYIYIYIHTYPEGIQPPCIVEPLFLSAQHGSRNPGFVLRPLSPYAIASLGVADLCRQL